MSSVQDSINESIYNNSRALQEEVQKETAKAQANPQPVGNLQKAGAVSPNDGYTTSTGAPGQQQSGVSLNSPAPLPFEPRQPAANDGGQGVGGAMGSLSGVNNVGDMSLAAEELNVGYGKTERNTQDQDSQMRAQNAKSQEKQDQQEAKAAAQRHLAEAAAIAACPLVGIIMTAVLEHQAHDQNNAQHKNQQQQSSGNGYSTSSNSIDTPVQGSRSPNGGQGQVAVVGPDGQPVVQPTGDQPQVNQGGTRGVQGIAQRPQPHSPQESMLVQQGAHHLAAASATLANLPQSRKVSAYGNY